MNHFCRFPLRALGLAFACALAVPAMADKPSWASGGNHGNKHEEYGQPYRDDSRRSGVAFSSDSRQQVNEYYGAEFNAGRCPPGLGRKNNGCLPPGQAKKWSKGRPLPGDVQYYDLPRDLLYRLPPPPQGHHYVRVASDVLLIAAGTAMVVDVIENIGRR